MLVDELLATFQPRQQSKPTRAPATSLPECEIKMNTPPRLRPKNQVSYAISDDSSPNTPGGDSPFSTPEHKVRTSRRKAVFEEDSEEDDDEPPKTPPPRQSSAGHSLRQHSQLNRSLKAQENADRPRRKKIVSSRYRVSKPRGRKPIPRITSDAPDSFAPTRTARNEVRDAIAAETAVKRTNFFVEKKDYFLPLLPENNAVSKIIAQRADSLKDTVEAPVIEYEELAEQPSG